MRLPFRKPGKYSQTVQDLLMTEDKFNKLQNKLERLKKARPKAAEEVATLAQMGDFSENVEYQLAKGRLRGINSNILILESQINNAKIIQHQKQNKIAQIGHTVTIENEKGSMTFQILGSSETNPQKGIISHQSPIGSAIIGQKAGDLIKIKIAGKEVSYKIIKIQ
jgi:transcription elongation factor GreA